MSVVLALPKPLPKQKNLKEDAEEEDAEEEADLRKRDWATFNPFEKGVDKNLFNADILHTVKIVYGNEGSRKPAKDIAKQAELLERLKGLPLWQLTVQQADVFSESSLLSDAYRKVTNSNGSCFRILLAIVHIIYVLHCISNESVFLSFLHKEYSHAYVGRTT